MLERFNVNHKLPLVFITWSKFISKNTIVGMEEVILFVVY